MLKNNPLGFFTHSGIIAAVLTAVIITGFAFASGGMVFSPGALNAQAGTVLGGVSSHAEIAGKCDQCHAPFWSKTTMADKCMVCHMDVAVQWLVPAPLHGALRQENPNLVCRNCHPEHGGKDAPLTYMDAVHFPHNSVGYSLATHQTKTDGSTFTCNDCHAKVYTSFDQAVCATCHAQIERAFMQTHSRDFSNDCLACHDGVETYGHDFDHTSGPFKLTGKHARLQCTDCHLNAKTLADLQAIPQDCNSCHAPQDPHQSRYGTDCAACHTTSGWTPATFDHNLSTFKLDGKHVNVPCEDCHSDHVFVGTPKDCISCHQKDDTHTGSLGTTCNTCHSTAAWKPAFVDHNLFLFVLRGQHTKVSCERCHINGIYKDTPTYCNSCHEQDDKHNGQYGTDCRICHNTTGWLPATFDHNLSTFKLTGQHVNTTCVSCHVNNVFKGTPTDCNSCHTGQDAHAGQFGYACGTCHSTIRWKPASFDHTLFGFNLTGAHTNLNCNECHSGSNYGGLSSACVACHAEPSIHAGVFGTDCAQCHSTSNWNATFNHPGGCEGNCANHENATCTQCHPVNYTSATCTACHDRNPGGG